MSTGVFRDHFSAHAGTYSRYRPSYPAALFDWLGQKSKRKSLVWDCATGNGQAALSLAERFHRVIATDGSRRQIEAATPAAGIDYRIARAEHSGIAAGSVDLVCVAQAAHWFDHGGFQREVERVLRPGGLLAIWGYGLCSIGADLEPALQELYAVGLRAFWPEQRRHIDQAYRSLPFPYPELTAPAFEMRAGWSRRAFLGYLDSWSAVQRCRKAGGGKLLDDFARLCARHWPEGETRQVRWPLFIRVGRKPG